MASAFRRQDLRQAIYFVIQNLKYWKLEDWIRDFYEEWLRNLDSTDGACAHFPPPREDESPRGPEQQLRYREFLDKELKRHVLEGRIPEHLLTSLKEENLRIQGELKLESQPSAGTSHTENISRSSNEPAEASSSDDSTIEQSNTNISLSITGKLLETILDPRSLQYLMMLGSAMLVLGLVIWLATQGFFDDPMVIAVGAALFNLALLGSGAYFLRFTKFKTAGRGIVLLACLAMPLHLWFYDA